MLASFLLALREGTEATLIIGIVLGALRNMGRAELGSTVHLDLRRFFQVTGGLLLLFAAGLLGHAVHEFNEVGWIPSIIEIVWNLDPLLDEASTLGIMLKALAGYNGNRSLTEALAYASYFGAVLLALKWNNRKASAAAAEACA